MTRIRLLTITALTIGLLGGMAPAAFAGDTPSPSPTFTRPVPAPQTCATRPVTFTPAASPAGEVSTAAYRGHPTPAPTVNPQRRCAPETFLSQFTALGSTVVQNRVIAAGPVFGNGSLDLPAQTSTFDRFRLPAFFRTVNVPHTGIAFPSIDLRLCAVSVNQVGLWRFARGTGLFRNAIGNGSYLLTGQWVFPRLRNGLCSLLFIRGNPILQNRIQPAYTNIQVWANGLARI